MLSSILELIRATGRFRSQTVSQKASMNYPWEIVQIRQPITSEDLIYDPEIKHEIERLQCLAKESISESPDWFLNLANKHTPLRAITAIHEAGHTFPYLSLYPDGGRAYATLSDNPKGEKSLCYPDSPKGYTIENLWWNICAKMAGPAAESLAIGHEFDGCTGTYDYIMCNSIQQEYADHGIAIRNLTTGVVDFKIQRSVAHTMMQFIFLDQLPLLTSIADYLCQYDRVPLQKIISESHSQGISIDLRYPKGQ